MSNANAHSRDWLLRPICRTAAIASALLMLGQTAQAQVRLGGLDLQSYCNANFGRNVHRIGPTVNDWRCGRRSFSVNHACRWTYGPGARAAYSNFNDANTWYCYR